MKQKQLMLSAALLVGLGSTGLYAQEAISASGGNASGSGGSVSYTIGQVVYTPITGTNGSAVQGIQQPYEISVVTELSEANGINLICSVYPNPASQSVRLKIENYKTNNLTYQLYDDNGKLIENRKVEGSVTNIDLNNLVIATFILNVSESNIVVKTFKIIKN